MVQGECILYPCYFNAAYTRRQGRRVSLRRGVKAPVINDLERALKRIGVTFRVDEHHHPAHWMRREGRVVVTWQDGKEALIKKVAQRLEVKR
jgi:signal recognition particle subunit SRP19